jgi:hypothetical protein
MIRQLENLKMNNRAPSGGGSSKGFLFNFAPGGEDYNLGGPSPGISSTR